MWRRIRWAWLVARYGEHLARAFVVLDNFERAHGQKRNIRDLMPKRE